MTIDYVESVRSAAGDRGIVLLEELFQITRGREEGVNPNRFRADHPDDIGLLDSLTEKRLLTNRWDGKKLYRPTLYALPIICHERSGEILRQAKAIMGYLHARYIERLGEVIEIAAVARELNLDYLDTAETFLYMRDGHSWFCGSSIDFPFGEDFPNGNSATITTCEYIREHNSIDMIISAFYDWNFVKKKGNRARFVEAMKSVEVKPNLLGVNVDIKGLIVTVLKWFKGN